MESGSAGVLCACKLDTTNSPEQGLRECRQCYVFSLSAASRLTVCSIKNSAARRCPRGSPRALAGTRVTKSSRRVSERHVPLDPSTLGRRCVFRASDTTIRRCQARSLLSRAFDSRWTMPPLHGTWAIEGLRDTLRAGRCLTWGCCCATRMGAGSESVTTRSDDKYDYTQTTGMYHSVRVTVHLEFPHHDPRVKRVRGALPTSRTPSSPA